MSMLKHKPFRKDRRMKKFITYLLLVLSLAIMTIPSLAEQNHNTLQQEVEALQNRVSELEGKLQTVENVEKMELAAKLAEAEAKLAEANAKLLNADIDKYKRGLKDENDEWLRTWSSWFLGIFWGIVTIVVTILCTIGAVLWSRFKSKTDQLIAGEVGKSLNEFEEAVGQVKIQQGQIKILEKEHAVSVLNAHMGGRFNDENPYPEQINILPESALLDIFNDETYYLGFRCWAAEVLASKESTLLVSPLLEFLNSAVDSDEYNETYVSTKRDLRRLASFLCVIHTQETYEGLNKFLNRLLTENPRHKDLFLTWTVFSLAYVGNELDKKDSVSMIRKTISDLNVLPQDEDALNNLVEYFNKFQEPEGIKEILTNGLTDGMPDLEKQCLELLQEHDPDFVNEWKAQKEDTNTESEES